MCIQYECQTFVLHDPVRFHVLPLHPHWRVLYTSQQFLCRSLCTQKMLDFGYLPFLLILYFFSLYVFVILYYYPFYLLIVTQNWVTTGNLNNYDVYYQGWINTSTWFDILLNFIDISNYGVKLESQFKLDILWH